MAALDPAGDVVRANHALGQLLGRPAEDLVGCPYDALLVEPDDELLEHLCARTGAVHVIEHAYWHPDGRTVRATLTLTPVPAGDGTADHYIAHLTDTGPRREAYRLRRDLLELERRVADLERSNERLAEFAAVVSHELKAPLAVVQGYLGLISDEVEHLSDDARGWIDRVERTTSRMSQLVTASLEVAAARHRSGAPAEPVAVAAAVRDVLEDLEPVLVDAHVEVDCPVGLTVLSAPALLRTLVGNLVTNAVKHARPGATPTVTISARPRPAEQGGGVQVLVDDDGPGLAGVLEVTRPFARGGTSTGHGLGLSTCADLMAWHGGDLAFATSPAGGLRVVCTFPPPPVAPAPTRATGRPPGAR